MYCKLHTVNLKLKIRSRKYKYNILLGAKILVQDGCTHCCIRRAQIGVKIEGSI